MAIRVVRLGTPRKRDEGLRLGTVRRPPRGVPKVDYGRRDYFDVWLPELAPSAEMVTWARSQPFTATRWKRYVKAYKREMSKPANARLLWLLAAMSSSSNFSIGCYCEDEERCHRSLLREILIEQGAVVI